MQEAYDVEIIKNNSFNTGKNDDGLINLFAELILNADKEVDCPYSDS